MPAVGWWEGMFMREEKFEVGEEKREMAVWVGEGTGRSKSCELRSAFGGGVIARCKKLRQRREASPRSSE
jgi:hypothetical protein